MDLSGLRPATPDDADAILDLVIACDIAELGEPDVEIDDITEDLKRSTYHGWVLDDPRGGLSGHCWVDKPAGSLSVDADAMIRPGGDAETLAGLVERTRAAATEIDASVPLRMFIASRADIKRTVVEATGASIVRHFWRMSIDLGEQPPSVPRLDERVTVSLAGDDDAGRRVMYDVLNPAFLDHYAGVDLSYDDWVEQFASPPWADRSLWWVATVDGRPVAALLAREWPDAGYVGMLGTLRAGRGKGLARTLLMAAFVEFHRRGHRRVGLSVDAASPTNAVALYTSVGMSQRHEWQLYQLPPLRAADGPATAPSR